jgi:hypothetical protein
MACRHATGGGSVMRDMCAVPVAQERRHRDHFSTDHPTTEVAPLAPRRIPATVVVLAVIGVVVTGYALWTWGSWLADGPTQITASRDPESASRWVARIYEALMVVAVVVLTVRIVRECRRERRLVFDAVIVVAGFLRAVLGPDGSIGCSPISCTARSG